MAWLSAYLYYNEPWEKFLSEAVLPYIEHVEKTGIADQSFFIRYWEYGPHIRLRFRGDENTLEAVLKPNLAEYFNNYFENNPSNREEPDYPDGFDKTMRWRPNHTVYFETYVPETNRFGGNRGMELAELQFDLSSKTVLQFFKEYKGELDYDEILGLAIRLHICFAKSIGLDTYKMVLFFNLFFENWLPRSLDLLISPKTDEEIKEKMQETVRFFRQAFEEQKEALISFSQNLLTQIEQGEVGALFRMWIEQNQIQAKILKRVSDKDQLMDRVDKYVFSQDTIQQLDEKELLLWSIWADFMHLTNNRLGILNRDEAYLAFLIRESIRVL